MTPNDDDGADRPGVPGVLGAAHHVAGEDVVDDHVGLERRDQYEPVEDQERRRAQDRKGLDFSVSLKPCRKPPMLLTSVTSRACFSGVPVAGAGTTWSRSFRKIAGRIPTASRRSRSRWPGPRLLLPCRRRAPALHDQQEPGRDHVRQLADEVLNAHQSSPLVVVGCQLVAEPDPGCREDGVLKIEKQRSDEEIPEVEGFALARGQLPEQGEDDANRDGADEYVAGAGPSESGCCRRRNP